VTNGGTTGFGALLPVAMTVAEVPLPAARERQFSTGRDCAGAALTELTGSAPAVPREPTGEPRWPAGVIGSITHGAGTCAAVVGRQGTPVVGVGIDAADHRPLSARVARRVLAGDAGPLARARADIAWDAVVFSAKEAVFKAWYPLTRRSLRFGDVKLRIDPGAGAAGSFAVVLLPVAAGQVGGLVWHGRYSVVGPVVRTVVTARVAEARA
jgi:4'-phosphopantetheinyl transferase EntD